MKIKQYKELLDIATNIERYPDKAMTILADANLSYKELNFLRSIDIADTRGLDDYIEDFLQKLKEYSSKTTIESGNIFSFCEYGFKPYSLMEILDDESGCKNGDVFFDMISGRYYMKTSGLGLQNAVWANGQFEPTMEIVSLNKELVSGKSFVQVTIKKDKSYYINGVENQYLPLESAEYLAGVLLIQNRCFPAVALANAFLERSSIGDVQKAEKVMEILSSLVLADNKRYLN